MSVYTDTRGGKFKIAVLVALFHALPCDTRSICPLPHLDIDDADARVDDDAVDVRDRSPKWKSLGIAKFSRRLGDRLL